MKTRGLLLGMPTINMLVDAHNLIVVTYNLNVSHQCHVCNF